MFLPAAESYSESWCPLPAYVRQCSRILLCEPEVRRGVTRYRVLEIWKESKSYRKAQQLSNPRVEYLPAGMGRGAPRKPLPKQMVFFFTSARHPTCFNVEDGKLIYAASELLGPNRREYTLDEFKEAIAKAVSDQAELAPDAQWPKPIVGLDPLDPTQVIRD